jgi:hypothetical protein
MNKLTHTRTHTHSSLLILLARFTPLNTQDIFSELVGEVPHNPDGAMSPPPETVPGTPAPSTPHPSTPHPAHAASPHAVFSAEQRLASVQEQWPDVLVLVCADGALCLWPLPLLGAEPRYNPALPSFSTLATHAICK